MPNILDDMDIKQIRALFPALEETVYGHRLVYLDNAATSQRLRTVLDKWEEISVHSNANIHRSVHRMSLLATKAYEDARDAVASYIGAADRKEIVFTSGATHALNLLAFSLGEALVSSGDEIIIAESEHHSNIVPWQMMAARKGAVIKVLPVDDKGCLRLDVLDELLSSGRAKVLCVAHVSNVLGVVNPISTIAGKCREKSCVCVVDGAQGIVHCDLDVRAAGCDFYVFSGHKMYAAPGTGVLYGREELLELMPPFMGGGEMIGTVKWTGTTYAEIPQKFEAGTQNLSGVPTLVPAIEFIQTLKNQENKDQSREIVQYLSEALGSEEGVTLYGRPESLADKVPLFSFTVEGVHHGDLALILDKMGFAVRSGQMCAEPLMDRFGVTGMVRASFAPYNTLQEAKDFVAALRRAVQMLK